jgi:hypothetical protein
MAFIKTDEGEKMITKNGAFLIRGMILINYRDERSSRDEMEMGGLQEVQGMFVNILMGLVSRKSRCANTKVIQSVSS